ncbi:MAG: RNA methyltransferase [Clostridia bacterium]|nr:RNA methyltransferase [Clostridia bacterium]
MPHLIPVTDLSLPALSVFTDMKDSRKRDRIEEQNGIFIAESPTVVDVALASGYLPVCALTEEKMMNSAVRRSLEACGDIPVYVASHEAFASLTGFELTRGLLCAMARKPLPSADDLLRDARRVCVLENVTDSTNMGAIVRSAAALGIDAVLLTPGCCDPLCRRALRVSMGTVLQVPWTRIGSAYADWPHPGLELLRERGFRTVAMALRDDSVPMDHPALKDEPRLAILMGTEGTGLLSETIACCDYTVRIPMYHGVDSLNVAAASAVAFWELRVR